MSQLFLSDGDAVISTRVFKHVRNLRNQAVKGKVDRLQLSPLGFMRHQLNTSSTLGAPQEGLLTSETSPYRRHTWA